MAHNSLRFLRSCFISRCDWFVELTPLFQPIRTKTKNIRDFPRSAPAASDVTVSNSDWLIVLFSSVLVEQSKGGGTQGDFFYTPIAAIGENRRVCPVTAIAIFADRIKLPVSGMSDIGD